MHLLGFANRWSVLFYFKKREYTLCYLLVDMVTFTQYSGMGAALLCDVRKVSRRCIYPEFTGRNSDFTCRKSYIDLYFS